MTVELDFVSSEVEVMNTFFLLTVTLAKNKLGCLSLENISGRLFKDEGALTFNKMTLMQNASMLHFVMQNVATLNAAFLNAVRLSIIMPKLYMQIVIMLSDKMSYV